MPAVTRSCLMEPVLSWTFTPPKMTTCWMGTLPPQVGNTGTTGTHMLAQSRCARQFSPHLIYCSTSFLSHLTDNWSSQNDYLLSWFIKSAVCIFHHLYTSVASIQILGFFPHPCSQCPCFKKELYQLSIISICWILGSSSILSYRHAFGMWYLKLRFM